MMNFSSKLPKESMRKVWPMELGTILKPSMIGRDHLLNCHPPRPHLSHSCWVACKNRKNNSMLQERSSLWLRRKLSKRKMLSSSLNLISEALVLRSCIFAIPFHLDICEPLVLGPILKLLYVFANVDIYYMVGFGGYSRCFFDVGTSLGYVGMWWMWLWTCYLLDMK